MKRIMHLLVPGGRRLTSLGVLSPVRRSSVAGPEEYCPRSAKWGGTGDGKVACRAYGVAGPRGKCGPGTEVPLTGNGKLGDLGRKCRTGGLWRCRSGGVLSPVREMGRDRGRKSGLESVWRRRSQGKVRTWDGSATDRGRNGHGPETQRSWTGDGNVGLVVCGVAGP